MQGKEFCFIEPNKILWAGGGEGLFLNTWQSCYCEAYKVGYCKQ